MKKAQAALPNQQLRLARKQHGWTQQEVAEGIGAPLALNVMRWERGMTKPSAHYVQRLCQLFGKSASELGLLADEDSQQQEAGEKEQATREAETPPVRQAHLLRDPLYEPM